MNDAIIGLGQTQVLRLKRYFQIKKEAVIILNLLVAVVVHIGHYSVLKVKLPAFVPPEMQSVITCVMYNNVFFFFNASVVSSDGTQNLLWGFVLTKHYFYSCTRIKYKNVNLQKIHIIFFN